MTKVRLKGINPVRDQRTGEIRYYAWRGKGAPRLEGEPGTPEFIASYLAATTHRPRDDGKVKALVTLYKTSEDYKGLCDSTRRQWAPWLDRITAYFGKLPVSAFDRHDRVKRIIRRWRDQYRNTPRTADYGVQVLSRVLSFAVDEGRLGANPCAGIKKLYDQDRSEIIWEAADLARMAAVASPELQLAFDLAAATGLRKGDLCRLAWSHIEDNEIVIRTGKSRGKIKARIPIHDGIRAVLDRAPKVSTIILTSSRRQPWTPDGLGTAINRAMHSCGLNEADLHFNDLRGTAATRFYLAGFPVREIAEIMAWSEDNVDKIIRRYVGRHAAVAERIRRINEVERRT